MIRARDPILGQTDVAGGVLIRFAGFTVGKSPLAAQEYVVTDGHRWSFISWCHVPRFPAGEETIIQDPPVVTVTFAPIPEVYPADCKKK
jgi:hypothetical protein